MITGKPTWRAHSFRAGKNRNSRALHGRAGFFFLAHQPGDLGWRPDELDIASLGNFGKVRVFRQQAVAGVDGIHVGDFRGADDRWDIEVALRQLRRANTNGFIGKTNVERIAVSLAVNSYSADAQFLAGTDHPQGNFSTICYQDFLKHLLACGKSFCHRGTETQRKAKNGKKSTEAAM
jgi:hypothetical protein